MATAYGGVKFSDVKAELATVTHNGVCADDPRVMQRTNEAIRAVLDELIPVGGMLTGDIVPTTESGRQILYLPKEFENAIEVEVLNGAAVQFMTDVTQGWNLVSNSTYVSPENAHDNPLIDLGLVADFPTHPEILRRKYVYPGLAAGATVRVTGAKRYVPITTDDDYLIVQNIRALKLVILSLERDENNAEEKGEALLQKALRILRAEVTKHQLDPTNSLKRKFNYQADLLNYAEGTLGRTRARLALELPGFLAKGKAEISYYVNRAVQMLVDNRNQLAIAGRIQVKAGVTELVYEPSTAAATVLAWSDYNQIRLMVQSFLTESADPNMLQVSEEYQRKAYELQKDQLIQETELLRHTTYTTALVTYVSGTFGWTVARLALEMPGGLALTTAELERTLSMAEMRLMERGIWKGCLKTVSASITGGDILFPRDVEAVLSADICGMPTDIRSIFFEFQKNGPGKGIGVNGLSWLGCSSRFTDQGEVFFNATGDKRRKYHFTGDCTNAVHLNAVCKVRWEQKTACDEMTVKNFEGLRLMCQAIRSEEKEDWQNAGVAAGMAVDVLEKELVQYLGGVQHVPNVECDFGMSGLGGML